MNIFFKLPDWVIFKSKYLNPGFSLVEMLMALLVASLLLAALAPVITKKMDKENIHVSGTGRNTSEHYAVFNDASKNGSEDNIFTVPSNAVNVRVTMIGGGGAGGGATFGSKIITASENNWKVPDGVKKIRVYMIGGGGGGASGGVVLANQLGDLKEGHKDFLTPGNYGLSVEKLLLDYAKDYIPPLDSKCSNSGNIWESNLNSFTVSVTGCGAGGAGGAGSSAGGGGSGGYVVNTPVKLNGTYGLGVAGIATAGSCVNGAQVAGYRSGSGGNGGAEPSCSAARTEVTGGASGGGTGGRGGRVFECSGTLGATAGGHATSGPILHFGGGGGGTYNGTEWEGMPGGDGSYFRGGGGGGGGTYDCGGGGGGGATSIANVDTSQFMASGGGGGGGFGGGYNNAGGGGGGGGWDAGGGGGGAGYRICSTGGGAPARNGFKGEDCGTCYNLPSNTCFGPEGHYFGGGGGGGGGGGKSGTSAHIQGNLQTDSSIRTPGKGGKIATIFGDEYCNGGDAGKDGKPGAMRISWTATNNAIKCKYNTYSNGASGGGGGQVWIGEINTTPGSYLNFHVGKGGEKQTNYSSNGNNGESTYITNQSGTTLISVSGGGGGKYSNATNISTSVGVGGGKLTSGWNDWTGQNTNTTGGLNGSGGQLSSNGAGGGKGGGVYFMDGSYLDGGNAGNAESNGADSANYGAGGGGGGGVKAEGHFPGYGGKGGDGYIYIEWGDTNGGGGSSGGIKESVKILSATAGTKIEVEIGKGGIAPNIEYDSNTKYKPGAKGEDGRDTKIIIKGKTYSARGGIGGNGGGLNKGDHGKGGVLEAVNTKSYDGSPGIDNYGGMGATAIYEFAANGEGTGGCGGNMIAGKCFSPSETPYGKNGAKSGSGGGGGAIKNSIPFKGGNGADGIVIIEWEEFME